jgi:hypothetical protein
MSDKNSGEKKRFLVECKYVNGNRIDWKASEADMFATYFLVPHQGDLKSHNVVLAEGPRDVDMIFDMTDGQVLSHVVLAPAAKQIKPKLDIPPGFKLHGWLSSVCPRSFKENVLDECLAEGTRMYQEMLAAGDFKGAKRVRWAMRFWMLRAVFGGFVTGALLLWGRFRKTSE